MVRKMTRSTRPTATGTGTEWLGGTTTLRSFVTGEGEPYQPEALVWVRADGAVLGTEVARPGELLSVASESLQITIEAPLEGTPHAPTRVRVASPELAEALRAGHPELEVVCAPTPELDGVLEMLRESASPPEAEVFSYLSRTVKPKAISKLFKAAAALYRLKPWDHVPDDQSVFSVAIEPAGPPDGVLSVFGQLGESFGFVYFYCIEEFEAYLDLTDAFERGEKPDLPLHIRLNFERGADLPSALRKEIAEFRWEVADADAYPVLRVIEEDGFAHPPTRHDVALATSIALALTDLMADPSALESAFEGGEPVTRTGSVRIQSGLVKVTLRAPWEHPQSAFDPTADPLEALAALARSLGEIDPEVRKAYEGELLRRFEASPEAEGVDLEDTFGMLMDLAANHLHHTIATLEAADLRTVIFELVPRKVAIAASEGRPIIEEMRAFYGFLKREFRLKQASACLKVLGTGAVETLEAALSDSSKFGLAKSMVMRGADAGFDIHTADGIGAWLEAMQGMHGAQPPRPAPPAGAPRQRSAKADQARKNKRKAARKARKKGR